MKDPTRLTQQRLREVLRYNPRTGAFTWMVNKGSIARIGDRAGCITKHGYCVITIDGEQVMAHRLAWFWMTREWPSDQIDHRNGIHHDNRFANLREATNQQNCENIRSPQANNRTGYLGVIRCGKRFAAQICVGGKSYHLGVRSDPAEAHALYVTAKRMLHKYGTL